MRWRIDLYVLREILGPLGLGFVVYTFILLLQALSKSAELIISRGVPIEVVGQMLWVSLPNIVVLTIPMALLFGILIAVGRLSADSELVALRASGVSLFSLSPRRPSMYRPILLLSALLGALNLYLVLEVMPSGNTALERIRYEIASQGLSEEIQPRTFYPAWEKKLLFVFEQPLNDPRWKGVFMASEVPFGDDDLWVADWGQAQYRDGGESVAVQLTNVYHHKVNLDEATDYDVALSRDFRRDVRSQSERDSAVASSRQMKSMHIEDLEKIIDDPTTDDGRRRRAIVERHKRFAIPAACIVFGLLALPLGITRSRGGKSSGFVVSIGIIMAYYVLLNWGEELAANGTLPPIFAVWMANVLMLVAGFYILAQRNRDKSLLLARLDQWIQNSLWDRILRIRGVREAKRQAKNSLRTGRRAQADVVVKLQPIAFRVLGRIDKYVLVSFLKVLVMAMLGGVSIYVIADLTDKIDDITENAIDAATVMTYYKYKTFAIVYQIAPIIILIATLITFALLSRSNEITAIKALGISLYRVTVPVLIAATLFAGLAGVLQSEVLPASNLRVAELEAIIKNQTSAQASVRRSDRQWLATQDNVLYNYLSYRPDRQLLYRLQIFRFGDDYRLTDRMLFETATYAGDGWWLVQNGWRRAFDGSETGEFLAVDTPRRIRLQLTPEAILGEGALESMPDGMNYSDLQAFIENLQNAGRRNTGALEVGLHNKIAYPAMSLVLALVALPFSFRLGRKGALYGIGMSLLLGIAFFIVLATFTALGENNILPPLIAVWSPGAIFAVFSLYLFLGVRT